MASSSSQTHRTFHLKYAEVLYDVPNVLKRCCVSLYCRLYKFVNTCYLMETMYSWYYGTLDFLFGYRQKLEWKTHWQSPVCRAILRRKHILSRTRHSLAWAACYAVIASVLFIDIQLKGSVFSHLFASVSDIIWYTECAACLTLFICSFVGLVLYGWSVFSKPMPISPAQQKLFRISENDPGFEVKKINESISDAVKPERLQFSSWRDSLECNSPSSFLSVTPINYSYNSWCSTSSGSPSFDTTSNSWNFYRPSSPINFSSTPKSVNMERSLLRKLNYSDGIESPYSRPIQSKKQLEEFLQIHEEEERKRRSISFEDSKPFMTKMTTVDNSPMAVLSKCRYQRAYRTPHSEATEDDSSESHCGDMLSKLKITDKMLTVWCERVRKWICQSILVKLVHEIDDINCTLTEIGLPEFQIGNVSLFALHQIAATKAQHLPTLTTVLPYIDMHSNQEYLVRRLKDLAHGGCMGDFKWNSGGSYDKEWCDDLPNDSVLIIYILCCYLDAHLPPDPHFPEGKPFSSKYFKKVPEKVILSKDLTYIYQSSVNPPQFKVVIGGDLYTLPKGRNNLFCALVTFLHYMKTKECGMLGRVNLGPSGMNMLWILD